MADETTLSLDLTTFVSNTNPNFTREQCGILNRLSQHLTAEEAKDLVEKLQMALAKLEVTEVA